MYKVILNKDFLIIITFSLGLLGHTVSAQTKSTAINHRERIKRVDGVSHESYRYTRSLQETTSTNQTVTYILHALMNLSSESDPASQLQQAQALGANLTANKILDISPSLRDYALDIISNITFRRSKDVTDNMIGQLQAMYKVFGSLVDE